jgi:hypothetical protein
VPSVSGQGLAREPELVGVRALVTARVEVLVKAQALAREQAEEPELGPAKAPVPEPVKAQAGVLAEARAPDRRERRRNFVTSPSGRTGLRAVCSQLYRPL